MASPSNPLHVRVPRPSSKSFNKQRPLERNTLLKNQVDHFRELEKRLLKELQTGIQYEAVATEGQAAEYIKKMTTILHPQAFRSGGK
jgi:hypothetical protein